MLVFERIVTAGLAELSYLVGDDEAGTAAVIDPRADVEVYLDLARQHGVAITHLFETHIHADLVSGARELAAHVAAARIFISAEGGAIYGFEHESVRGGDRFEFGDQVLTARHTPGHTPEHLSYLIAEKARAPVPWGVFSGDALFVNSAGRPDLLGRDEELLADLLFGTLRHFFLGLDDGVIVHPAHGSGSPCGGKIGARLETTIGYERRFNPFLQIEVPARFRTYALSGLPPEPTYYQRLKKLNAHGPEVLGRVPEIPALPVERFAALVEAGGAQLVDTRPALAFGGGHIAGALHLGGSPLLSVWAGWMLDPEVSILLLLENDEAADEIARYFVRTGYTRFAGFLAGGLAAWAESGRPLVALPQITAPAVAGLSDQAQVLDVRAPAEWAAGHIPGARHIFVPELRSLATELRRDQPIITYCATGYRASLAASILQQLGFPDVRTMPGGWSAWQQAGLPTAGGGSESG